MADHPFDPHSDQIPQDSFTLAAHEALALVAGSSLAQFFECIPATVWMTDTDLEAHVRAGADPARPGRRAGESARPDAAGNRARRPRGSSAHSRTSDGAGGTRDVGAHRVGRQLFNVRIAPLRDASGAIIGCVGSHQQIGWLPDDDGLLRESDMRLRRIIDSNMIGIAFGNDEGRITEANEAFLQLAGYTREDLVADGISWPALTPVEFHTAADSGHRRGARHRPMHAVRSGSDSPRRPPRARARGRSTPLRPAPGRRRLRARHLGPARARPPHGRGAGVRRRAAQRADARSGNRRRARGGLRDARLEPRHRSGGAPPTGELALARQPGQRVVRHRRPPARGRSRARRRKAQWSDHEAILAVPMSPDTSLVVAHGGPSALCPWVVETTPRDRDARSEFPEEAPGRARPRTRRAPRPAARRCGSRQGGPP